MNMQVQSPDFSQKITNWAMLIAGMATVGIALRRRRKRSILTPA